MKMVTAPVRRVVSLLPVFLASPILLAGVNVWTTNGPAGQVTALTVDPQGLALFAATTFEARSVAYRSLDHGSSWTAVGEAPMYFGIPAIEVDASHREIVYAATATPPGAFPAGDLYRSLDAGSSWFSLAGLDGFLTAAMRSAFAEPSALYAAGTTCECLASPCFAHLSCKPTVRWSHDSGETWTSSSDGLSGWQLTSIEIDPFDATRLLAGGDFGAFTSIDGGAHWSAANRGLESCPWVTSLAADRSRNVFYATTARYAGESLGCGGVFRTDDGGRTWRPTGLQNLFPTSIAIDASRPGVVYAGASKPGPLYPDGGVFRSSDGGRTWERIGIGLPESGVLRLVVEAGGAVVHAGTLTGVYDLTIVPGARPPVLPPRSRATRTLPARP